MSDTPHAAIWIDPGRMGGVPCLHGTRIDVDTIANYVSLHGVDWFLRDYELPDRRRDVLACCAWWTLNPTGRQPKWERATRTAWTPWVQDAWVSLWSGDGTDTPDPPKVTT